MRAINGTRRWRLWHGGVAPPFLRCPDCAAEHYGVVEFCGRAVERKCLKCQRTEVVKLSPLRKQVLYLDQNALSNPLFVMRPDLRKKPKQKHADFWQAVFDLIVELVHSQALVCPPSFVHRQERAPFPFGRELEALSRYLGQDIEYRAAREIEREQLCQHFALWLDGGKPDDVSFNPHAACEGDTTEWSAVLFTGNGVGEHPELAASFRRSKQSVHEDVTQIHARDWKDPTKDFEHHFRQELSGYYGGYRTILAQNLAEAAPILAAIGRLMPFQFHIYQNPILVLASIASQRGAKPEDAFRSVESFFASEHFAWVPFARAGALAWAQIARQAGQQHAGPPNAGMGSDVFAFSRFGQFSDAMFTDTPFHMILCGPPCSTLRTDRCRIFSLQHKEKFLDYLKSMRVAIPAHQFALVESAIPAANKPTRK